MVYYVAPLVVTRPRSNVTAIQVKKAIMTSLYVVTRPRSNVTAILSDASCSDKPLL